MWWSFGKSMSHEMLDVITEMAMAGASAPKIRMYTGTVPANADAALPGDVLEFATLTCSATMAPAAANKCLTFNPILAHPTINFPALAANGPTFFRLMDSDDNVILQGDITDKGDGGIIQIDYANLAPNTPVQVKKLVLMLG